MKKIGCLLAILFIIGLAKGSKPKAPPQSYDPGPPQPGQSNV